MEEADTIGVVVRLAKVLEITLADLGLTMNQFRLLQLVHDGSPSATELSLRLVMKPPNVSAMTSTLVRRGLLTQYRRKDDGRRRVLAVTREGEQTLLTAHERCAQALHLLAERSGKGEDLFQSLGGWLPALDEAAAELRRRADGSGSTNGEAGDRT